MSLDPPHKAAEAKGSMLMPDNHEGDSGGPQGGAMLARLRAARFEGRIGRAVVAALVTKAPWAF